MARIEIETQRIQWIRPSKLTAAEFERAKEQIGMVSLENFGYDAAAYLLHPESYDQKELLRAIVKEARIYVGTIVLVLILSSIGLGTYNDLPMGEFEIIDWIVGIPFLLSELVAIGFGIRFLMQCVTYWPSILLYIYRNKKFIEMRYNSVQRVRDYEDYVNLEYDEY